MITATAKAVPVRILAWDADTCDITVEVVSGPTKGRVRCLPWDALQATGGHAELLHAMARLKQVAERGGI